MKQKNAVFILLGQSNAVGHALPMRQEDRMETPLTHVFGLHRQPNQSFDSTRLVWSGYESGGMNLAEEQDHTYSIANCLAALWQQAFDAGCDLPKLYVVQIAIGAQGVTKPYLWHPDRAPKLIPGKLGTVNISLFPFCEHIFTLLNEDFALRGEEYEVIGLHWRGGENDTSTPAEELVATLEPIYHRIFDRFHQLLASPPTVLHRLVCPERMLDTDPTGSSLKGMHYVNEVFDRLAEHYPNLSVFDPRTAPYYKENETGHGMFLKDKVHFTEEMNRWIAQGILNDYQKTHQK